MAKRMLFIGGGAIGVTVVHHLAHRRAQGPNRGHGGPETVLEPRGDLVGDRAIERKGVVAGAAHRPQADCGRQHGEAGEHGDAETYVSLSDGSAWSTPVNVTNNHDRTSFAHTPIGRRSSVSSLHRTYPGPAAATLDNTGHLLLALISKESTSFGGESYGLTTFSGESTTPTLRFLKF